MNEEVIYKRRQELQLQCEREQLDWQERIKGLPEDDHGLILAVLATSLRFSLRGAFDPSKSIADLDRERQIVDAESKRFDCLTQGLNRDKSVGGAN